MSYRVTHICLSSPANSSEHITHVMVTDDTNQSIEVHSLAVVIRHLKQGIRYYDRIGIKVANIIYQANNGKEYIRTEPDDSKKDNLLSLPAFKVRL